MLEDIFLTVINFQIMNDLEMSLHLGWVGIERKGVCQPGSQGKNEQLSRALYIAEDFFTSCKHFL